MQAGSSTTMEYLIAILGLLLTCALLPARSAAQDAETPDPAVVQAIESADVFAQQGSWSDAARVLRGTGSRARRGSR